jgi:nucleoside-diphosphate-sugar epimerase
MTFGDLPAAMPAQRGVLVTGGTGYIGSALVPRLIERGHRVRVLVRAGSQRRVPPGSTAVPGDALDADAIAGRLERGDTLVHLVGTPHPNPSKAAEFVAVDLASIRAAACAAARPRKAHLVYVSVAQSAPVMRAYLAARAEGERAITQSGVTATVLRPWYVLGPAHRWPYLLLPLYALAETVPAWRDGARRLGLVSRSQMVEALVQAVEQPPPAGIAVVDVPRIRAACNQPVPPTVNPSMRSVG